MSNTDKRTQIYLPNGQYRDLQSHAQRRGVSMAFIVREALAEYTSARQSEINKSPADPLADLIGCFDDDATLSATHDDILYPKK